MGATCSSTRRSPGSSSSSRQDPLPRVSLVLARAREPVGPAGIEDLPYVSEHLGLEVFPPYDHLDHGNVCGLDAGFVAPGFRGVEVELDSLGEDEGTLTGDEDGVRTPVVVVSGPDVDRDVFDRECSRRWV